MTIMQSTAAAPSTIYQYLSRLDNDDEWSSDFSDDHELSSCGSLDSEESGDEFEEWPIKKFNIEASIAGRAAKRTHSLALSQPLAKKLRPTTCEPKKTVGTTEKKPSETLRSLLQAGSYKTTPSLELKDFFFKPSAETVAGYDMEIATAVRQNDVATLKRLAGQGRNLQVGNSSGMSVIHTASRRGSYEALEYLIRDAGVNPLVRCDYGRTPLHDACWSPNANLKVAELLLDLCPDFLYMTDSRGFTPLDYVHKSNWAAWNTFLRERAWRRGPSPSNHAVQQQTLVPYQSSVL